MGDPAFEPMQQPGERRQRRQGPEIPLERRAVFQRENGQRAANANADIGQHAANPENESQPKGAAPGPNQAHQDTHHPRPGHPLGRHHPLGRRGDGAARHIGDRLGRHRRPRHRGRHARIAGRRLARLFGHQPTINAVLGHQVLVATGLGDPPAVEGDNPVATNHAGQAVSQDQDGAADHQTVEGTLDDRLVFRVDRRQRLIQDQDRRVSQQRAGDGHPLALPARQFNPLFTDDGLVTGRQTGDEVMDIGRPRGGDQLFLAGLGRAHAQVFLNRAMEKVGILRDHGDLPANGVEGQVAQVMAAQQHAPALRVMKAQQQPHNRRFATAGWPNHADPLAGGDSEIQTAVNRARTARIAEVDILEGQGRDDPGRRGRPRGHLRCAVQQPVQPLGRRQPDHSLVQHAAQVAHRPENLGAEHQNDQKFGQPHGAVDHPPSAHRQRRRRANRDGAIGDAARQGVAGQHPHGGALQIARLVGQEIGPRPRLAKGFQGRQPLDRIQHLRGESAIGVAPFERAFAVE